MGDATQKRVDRLREALSAERAAAYAQLDSGDFEECIEATDAALATVLAQRPPVFFDENGADASPGARELRHRVQAEVLGILEKLDATQEREGRDLDVANRLEAAGLLFEVFAQHAQRPPVSPEVDRLRAQVEAAREAWWSGTEQGDTGLVYTDRIEDAMDAIWDAVGHADWTPRERPPFSPEQREGTPSDTERNES